MLADRGRPGLVIERRIGRAAGSGCAKEEDERLHGCSKRAKGLDG
jgi:hypothetical protein